MAIKSDGEPNNELWSALSKAGTHDQAKKIIDDLKVRVSITGGRRFSLEGGKTEFSMMEIIQVLKTIETHPAKKNIIDDSVWKALEIKNKRGEEVLGEKNIISRICSFVRRFFSYCVDNYRFESGYQSKEKLIEGEISRRAEKEKLAKGSPPAPSSAAAASAAKAAASASAAASAAKAAAASPASAAAGAAEENQKKEFNRRNFEIHFREISEFEEVSLNSLVSQYFTMDQSLDSLNNLLMQFPLSDEQFLRNLKHSIDEVFGRQGGRDKLQFIENIAKAFSEDNIAKLLKQKSSDQLKLDAELTQKYPRIFTPGNPAAAAAAVMAAGAKAGAAPMPAASQSEAANKKSADALAGTPHGDSVRKKQTAEEVSKKRVEELDRDLSEVERNQFDTSTLIEKNFGSLAKSFTLTTPLPMFKSDLKRILMHFPLTNDIFLDFLKNGIIIFFSGQGKAGDEFHKAVGEVFSHDSIEELRKQKSPEDLKLDAALMTRHLEMFP